MIKEIKKRRYIHTTEYYSAIRKSEILPFAWQHAWTLRILCYVESVRQRKTNTIRFHLYMGSKSQNKGRKYKLTHKYRNQIGNCGSGGRWAKVGKGD